MPATQPRNLQGQKALVTGATSGIGRAVALQLARDGAEVIVHGRDAARGAETVDAITAAGGHARFVGADLSDPADLQRLVKAVGEIDILVNNAGFSWFGATPDLKVETFDALFASNVRAARSEEHTSELQSQSNLVCRLLLEKKKHRQTGLRHLHHAHNDSHERA